MHTKKKEKETAWCISCQDSWGKRFLKKKKKKKKIMGNILSFDLESVMNPLKILWKL